MLSPMTREDVSSRSTPMPTVTSDPSASYGPSLARFAPTSPLTTVALCFR